MASKKNKATSNNRKGRAASKNQKKKREPPTKSSRRRNAAPATSTATALATIEPSEPEAERQALTSRVDEMGGSHMSACVAAGVVGNALGVIMAGQGWVPPKLIATLMLGAGAATTGAGWYWEMDHMMAAGAGLTAAGAFSLTNQFAVDAYEAIEKRAEEKRAEREAKNAEAERAKRLAEARALLEAEKPKPRNARQFVILDDDGEPLDYELLEVA